MAGPIEILVGGAVEVAFITIAIAILYRVYGWFFAVPKRQIVQAFQRGVVLRGSEVEKVIGPGGHWITPKRRLVVCDVRPTPFQVPSQEMLTADGLTVRISMGGEYLIVDPASFVTQSSDAFGAFYLEIRQALRISVGELTAHNFTGGQAQLPSRMKELLVPRGSQLGIELTQLEVYEAVPVGWLRPA